MGEQPADVVLDAPGQAMAAIAARLEMPEQFGGEEIADGFRQYHAPPFRFRRALAQDGLQGADAVEKNLGLDQGRFAVHGQLGVLLRARQGDR